MHRIKCDVPMALRRHVSSWAGSPAAIPTCSSQICLAAASTAASATAAAAIAQYLRLDLDRRIYRASRPNACSWRAAALWVSVGIVRVALAERAPLVVDAALLRALAPEVFVVDGAASPRYGLLAPRR